MEMVFGAQATVYHGTKANPQELIQSILNNEFRPGEGKGFLYGKGLYAVHELNNTPTGRGAYGNHVLKLKVKLDDYIIFDSDVAIKVYGKPLLPQEQALRAGLDDAIVKMLGKNVFNRLFDPGELSSYTAKEASQFLAGKCKGIVYTGENDRRCVLIYDPTTMIPVGWKSIKDPDWNPAIEDWYPTDEKGKAEKREKKLNWNLTDKSELRGAARRSASGEWEEEKYSGLRVLQKLEKLPLDQRVVKGDLDLQGTSITSLPQGLKVNGSLYLQKTPITSLPQGLEVGGGLILHNTPITSLPQGLKVGRALRLDNTFIASLPQDLKVGGDLWLTDTPITSLPQGLKVGGGLYLSGTPITSLPRGLVVGGTLYLLGTPITSLPQGLVVDGDLILTGTPITSLPQSLKVGVDLSLQFTPITSLPQDLKVGRNLWLNKTPITSLPRGLEVGGNIHGFKGDRSKVPPHLQGKIQ
jgi:hypothetical protein